MKTGWIRTRYGTAALLAAGMIIFLVGGAEAQRRRGSTEFDRYLAYVDRSLQKNPNFVPNEALMSCQDRRNHAAWLNRKGEEIRAVRSLKYCFSLLGLSEADVDRAPDPRIAERRRAAALAAIKKGAEQEDETASALIPDIRNGLEIYRECAACHMPEGWGMKSGIVPQLDRKSVV